MGLHTIYRAEANHLYALKTTASITNVSLHNADLIEKLKVAFQGTDLQDVLLRQFGDVKALLQLVNEIFDTMVPIIGMEALSSVKNFVLGNPQEPFLSVDLVKQLFTFIQQVNEAKNTEDLRNVGQELSKVLSTIDGNRLYFLACHRWIKQCPNPTEVPWKEVYNLYQSNSPKENLSDLIEHGIIGIRFEDARDEKEKGNPILGSYDLYKNANGIPSIRTMNNRYVRLMIMDDRITIYKRIADSRKLRHNMITSDTDMKIVNVRQGVIRYFKKDNIFLYRVATVEYEAHHLIPAEVYLNHAFFKKVRRLTKGMSVQYDINRKSNGIFLPNSQTECDRHKENTQGLEGCEKEGQDLPWHSGSHHEFSDAVKEVAARKMTDNIITSNNYLRLITELEDEARKMIFAAERTGKRLAFQNKTYPIG
jgi:hypothetical protein